MQGPVGSPAAGPLAGLAPLGKSFLNNFNTFVKAAGGVVQNAQSALADRRRSHDEASPRPEWEGCTPPPIHTALEGAADSTLLTQPASQSMHSTRADLAEQNFADALMVRAIFVFYFIFLF